MYIRGAFHLLLVIGIFISFTGTINSANAADTKLTGYVYEFDEKYEKQKSLSKVTVKVKSKEETEIATPETDDKGYYEIKTTSDKDPLVFIYIHKDYNPCPKRVVQNDLKDKALDSVALVKIRGNAKDYKASELVRLSQGVVEVMLILQPTDELMDIAKYLSGQLYMAETKAKAQAVNIDPSTFYNIHRLIPTNVWLKKDLFNDYLRILYNKFRVK